MSEKKAKLLAVLELLTEEQEDALLTFASSLVRQNAVGKATSLGRRKESEPIISDKEVAIAPVAPCDIQCSVCGKEVPSDQLGFHVHSSETPAHRKGMVLCGKCGKWWPESFMRWHFSFYHTEQYERPDSVPRHMLRSGGLFNRK